MQTMTSIRNVRGWWVGNYTPEAWKGLQGGDHDPSDAAGVGLQKKQLKLEGQSGVEVYRQLEGRVGCWKTKVDHTMVCVHNRDLENGKWR